VIRVPGLSTDYSLTIGGRGVILLVSTSNWFRNNWSAAHELGHLALGHRAERNDEQANEGPVDTFAAALLLPGDLMWSVDWKSVDNSGLAEFVWGTTDPTMRREAESTRCRFPLRLLSDLARRVEAGQADPAALAWMFGCTHR
jgi:hypothetical protein